MDYVLEKLPAACVLRFEGDLSGQAEVELKRLFVRMRQDGDVRIAADLRNVAFMDSNVLGTLVWALKNFREVGGDLRLFGLRDFVQRLFDITGLNQAFRLYDAESEAVDSFGAA
jgi:anti-sigma B factor antagonist